MCLLYAISTPVSTGSDTTVNLAVLQTGTTDPKSRDVSFRRQRPDVQSCTLLGAYTLDTSKQQRRMVHIPSAPNHTTKEEVSLIQIIGSWKIYNYF